jgi:hypothetical protein
MPRRTQPSSCHYLAHPCSLQKDSAHLRRDHSIGRQCVVTLCATLAVSCASSGPTVAAGLPPAPEVVNVRMEEYRFVYDKAIRPGRTIFKVVNVGKEDHSLVMFPAPADFPPFDVQLHGDERRAIPPFAQVFPRKPGEAGSFAVDVQPGQRYVFLCLVPDGAGISHALKGMNSEFVPLSAEPTGSAQARTTGS